MDTFEIWKNGFEFAIRSNDIGAGDLDSLFYTTARLLCSSFFVIGCHTEEPKSVSMEDHEAVSKEVQDYVQMCTKQDLAACHELGQIYFYGLHHVRRNRRKAQHVWSASCEDGHEPSCRMLKVSYTPEEPPKVQGSVDSYVNKNIHMLERGVIYAPSFEALNPTFLEQILQHPRVGEIHDVSLFSNGINHTLFDVLLRSEKVKALTHLNIGYNPIGDLGIRTFVGSAKVSTLERLLMVETGVSESGIKAMVSSPHLKNLQFLQIGGLSIEDAEAIALAPLQVKSVDLFGSLLTGKSARYLIENVRWNTLFLNKVHLGPGALRGLQKISPTLQNLSLELTKISTQDIIVLSTLESPSLKTLNLSYCKTNDEGLLAIGTASWFSQLEILEAPHGASKEARMEFIKRWTEKGGGFLSIYVRDLPQEYQNMLLEARGEQ